MIDFILNNVGNGIGSVLQDVRFDPGLLRPYINNSGVKCVTITVGRNPNTGNPVRKEVPIAKLQARGINSPVFNSTALRKNEWIEIDRAVLQAARYRLQAWADLMKYVPFSLPNAMGKTVLEHETANDPFEAHVDMDGLTEGRSDSARFQLEGLPLPITHVDFNISARKLMASRNSGTPLDTSMPEAASRRVGEKIEKTVIGTNSWANFGPTADYGRTPSVYGFTNFPDRVLYTSITTPTGTNPEYTVNNVLAMRKSLQDNKMYGPYMLYHTPDWDQYLDNDYLRLVSSNNSVGGNLTLRDRLKKIEGILDVKRLDMFFNANVSSSTGPGGEEFTAVGTSPFQMVLVQMTNDVIRAVDGMPVTTVQWEAKGGMQICFKVMAIQVPQLRADYYGNCGILHGTTA